MPWNELALPCAGFTTLAQTLPSLRLGLPLYSTQLPGPAS